MFYAKEVEDSKFDSSESMGKPIGSRKAISKSKSETFVRSSGICKQCLQNEEDACKMSNKRLTKKNFD